MKKVVPEGYKETILSKEVNLNQIVIWEWEDNIKCLNILFRGYNDRKFYWKSLEDITDYYDGYGYDSIKEAIDKAMEQDYRISKIFVFDNVIELGEYLSKRGIC